jgi:hypothetical protein
MALSPFRPAIHGGLSEANKLNCQPRSRGFSYGDCGVSKGPEGRQEVARSREGREKDSVDDLLEVRRTDTRLRQWRVLCSKAGLRANAARNTRFR